jgi:polygalacturonase
VTWSGEHFVKGKIIIESGGRLNIAPGAVIHFRSSDYEAYETSIVVKPGGLLYVDNATLTGIDYFGTNINGTGGVRYNSGWKGILVEGTGSFGGNHGQASILNQSIIEFYAERYVRSPGTGSAHTCGCRDRPVRHQPA